MSQTDTLNKTKVKTSKPRMYKDLLVNDDYTPMDFVVLILMRFFHKSEVEAINLMMSAHQKGSEIVGVYTFEVAETKVTQTLQAAHQEGHPLKCTLEPE